MPSQCKRRGGKEGGRGGTRGGWSSNEAAGLPHETYCDHCSNNTIILTKHCWKTSGGSCSVKETPSFSTSARNTPKLHTPRAGNPRVSELASHRVCQTKSQCVSQSVSQVQWRNVTTDAHQAVPVLRVAGTPDALVHLVAQEGDDAAAQPGESGQKAARDSGGGGRGHKAG